MKHRIAFLASLACAIAFAAACGGGDEESAPSSGAPIAEDQALVDAAKKEGTVTWYASSTPEAIEATVEAFEERYPDVDVESLRLTSGQVATRYAEERSSGAATADLVSLSDTPFLNDGDEKDWFEKQLDLPALKDWPKDGYEGGRATIGILPFGVGSNRDKASDAPTTWEGLTDPRWKDQIIYGDPRTVPGYLALAELWRKEYGEDFLKKFAAQNLKVVESAVPGGQQLAAGGASLIVPGSSTTLNPLIEEGAPIKFTPVSPTTGVEFVAVVSTDTPHPNAARLLMNFIMSKPGQAAVNTGGQTSLLGKVADDTPPLPEGYQPVDPLLADATKREQELLGLLGLEG